MKDCPFLFCINREKQISLKYLVTCFILVRFFDGIVELAVHTASVRDPQNLALYYFENGSPEQPGPGYDAFLIRYENGWTFQGTMCLLYEKLHVLGYLFHS